MFHAPVIRFTSREWTQPLTTRMRPLIGMPVGAGAFMVYEDARRRLGGEILGYIGFFLCLATIHGKFTLRCSAATFLFLIAVALNLIGKHYHELPFLTSARRDA